MQKAYAGDKKVAIVVNDRENLTGAKNVLVVYGAGDASGARNNTITIGKEGVTILIGQSKSIV